MKTERRHELEQNLLADWLAEKIVKIREYSRVIVATIVGVVVIAFLAVYIANRSGARKEAVWQQYIDATTGLGDSTRQATEEFERVVSSSPDSPAAHWARLTMADIQLTQGCEALFTNREDAPKNLADAERNYSELAKSAPEATVRERAAFGVAKAREAQGRVDDALQAYDEFLKAWPTSVFASAATARRDDLKKSSIKEFYTWFEMHAKKSPVGNEAGIPGHRPNFDFNSLPQTPRAKDDPLNFDLKTLTPVDKDEKDAKPAPGEKTDAKSETGDTKPAETKPGETKPADTKPSDAKPAETKPAEPKADEKSDAKPADAKPAENKSTDDKPTEPKP